MEEQIEPGKFYWVKGLPNRLPENEDFLYDNFFNEKTLVLVLKIEKQKMRYKVWFLCSEGTSFFLFSVLNLSYRIQPATY